MAKTKLKKLFTSAFFLLAVMVFSPWAHADDSDFQPLELTHQNGLEWSSVLNSDQPFNSVVVRSNQELDGLFVQYDQGEWEQIDLHDDGWGPEIQLFTEPSTSLRFKIDESIDHHGHLHDVEVEQTLEVMTFFEGENQFGVGGPSSGLTTMGVRIISRLEWGADEQMRVRNTPSLPGSGNDVCEEIETNYGGEYTITSTQRYNEQGQELIWPIKTTGQIEKFAIHHTDSEIRDINGDGMINQRDYAAMVRAIYSYHTNTRGWGDIGYNYLIDPDGNIYEGRAGGDFSIGAHSLCFNPESLGIAIIGNYQNEPISPEAFEALTNLIAEKGKQYGIDPSASSEFRGKFLDNVYGHRDVRSTSCPGDMLYAQLDEVRQTAALIIQGLPGSFSLADLDYNAALTSSLSAVDLDPGASQKVTLSFKNTGNQTWTNETWLHVADNDSGAGKIAPIVDGKTFVGAELNESSVAPGETGTFDILIVAGDQAGYYSRKVTVVANQNYKISRASQFVEFNVRDPNYDYEFISADLPLGDVYPGQVLNGYSIQLKNLGEATWYNSGDNQVRLAADNPRGRGSEFVVGNRPYMATLLESEVPTGQIGTFVFKIRAPYDHLGPIVEYFSPVMGESAWFPHKDLNFTVNVVEPIFTAKTVRAERVPTLRPGESKAIQLTMTNTGNVPWDPDNFKVTALGDGIRTSEHFIEIDEVIPPGESIVIQSTITASLTPGFHNVYWRARVGTVPVRGGYAKFVIKVEGDPVEGATDDSFNIQPVTVDPDDLPMLPGTSTTSNTVSDGDDFRVRLSHYAETATLTADTPFQVTNGSGQVLYDLSSGDQVFVSKAGDGFNASFADQTKTAQILRLVPKERSGVTEIVSWERHPAWDPSEKYNDNRFRDTIEMRVIDGKVYYINELLLEDYLRGLAELGNGAHRQKELVIATLARSYAYHYMDEANRKFPSMPWDGSDDPAEFQKYLGYSYEMRSASFVNAVESTAGEVVTYQGQPIKTPYFSRSAGYTKSAEDVWGWSAPYLVSVPDPWCDSTEFAGHGVGLSGCGAEIQAQQGKNYKEIIKYYYNDLVEIEKVY